ncbi:ABC transporter ATP-binding protein [Bacillus dakarensis]|uniref:ABC transporter ATP-binding protein n=1 Tax=Robertmurraya dakarensis TaxID=1926278 RepID=UPI0009819403|nr:ABC transporter ATP-binding protein [Bacillus dakarensis]
MNQATIQLDEVSKQYDDVFAVRNLSLTISKGEIFGLLGPNGAGKTTTILMLLGLSEPTSGSVRVCGIDSIKKPIEVKRRVGYLPDNIGFYQNMTGLENLLYTAQLNNIPRDEARKRAEYLLDKVNLSDAANKKAGKYSRGMKQRLGLADVLMKNPEVIILDEPTLGIDPEGVRELLKMIRELGKEEGMTVLLSSHHLHQVQQICDRVGIFVKGQLIAEGNVQSLAKKLFPEATLVITVHASPIPNELVKEVQLLEHVQRVQKIEEGLEITCYEDISAVISKVIVEMGSDLTHISKKNFGLDEIYHRYFEGRELHESY